MTAKFNGLTQGRACKCGEPEEHCIVFDNGEKMPLCDGCYEEFRMETFNKGQINFFKEELIGICAKYGMKLIDGALYMRDETDSEVLSGAIAWYFSGRHGEVYLTDLQGAINKSVD